MKKVELKGEPREMGQIHGESFRQDIKELVDIRLELLSGFLPNWSREQIEETCLAQLDKLKEHKGLYEEFCGIAESSNTSHIDMIILNNYTDMRDYQEPLGGCSLFAYRQGSKVYCGQTWDMHASAQPYTLLMQIGNDEPNYVLSLTGCLGMAGINQHNVSVMINNMHCLETSQGLIWPALVRAMLVQNSAKKAKEFFTLNLPCSGHNYQISDIDETYNIECTGKQFRETFRGSEGITWHTNHYISELSKHEKKRKESTSQKRYDELKEYFENEEIEDLEQIKHEVFKAEKVCSVAMPKPTEPHAPMTCGGLVLDLKERKGCAFSGNLADGDELPLAW